MFFNIPEKWREMPAFLFFLTKFIHPINIESLIKKDYWKSILKNNPKNVIEYFIKTGIIIEASIEEKIENKCKVPDLKKYLREYNLPISGKKNEMVNRLLSLNKKKITSLANVLKLFKCSEEGARIASKYLKDEEEKRKENEIRITKYLTENNFDSALKVFYTSLEERHKIQSLNSFGLPRVKDKDIEFLKIVFNSVPKILNKISNENINVIRYVTALNYLGGFINSGNILPDNFITGINLDYITCSLMYSFYANNMINLNEYKKIGVKKVKILTCHDGATCDSCIKYSGKKYSVESVIELPNPNCTSDEGCRCTYRPLF
jgi:hypothetical protein